MDPIDYLETRRSVKAKELLEPAPSDEELRRILTVGMRVPDHGKLAPWRIKILHKEGQRALGDLCAELFKKQHPDANDKQLAFERDIMMRAPLLLAVLYTPALGRIPEWEQQLSAGAVCMNILHGCHALGYGAQWLSEWPAYHAEVKYALGGTLEDKIAGFIYIGSYGEKPEERPRPAYDEVVSVWGGG